LVNYYCSPYDEAPWSIQESVFDLSESCFRTGDSSESGVRTGESSGLVPDQGQVRHHLVPDSGENNLLFCNTHEQK